MSSQPVFPTNVKFISPTDIQINHERFRKDMGDVKELAESIAARGLLNPIILDDNNELVAGHRRLQAMQMLGWDVIPYFNKGDMTELERREVELEENIRRKAFHWLEEQKAIMEIHRLRTLADPNWSAESTATVIGKTGKGKAAVSEAKTIVTGVELFPEVKDAKSKRQALSWIRSMATTMNRTLDVRDAIESGEDNTTSIIEKLVLGDSVDVIKSIPDASFHAIITDPPFGIDYDHFKDGKESQLTAYEDSAESYERLLTMADDLYRVLKPNGWMVWFLGMSWYERVKIRFREAGFSVDELPIIWDRSEGRTHTNRPDRFFARAYDIALHCFKGTPEIVQRGKPNIIRVKPIDVSERHLTVERPPDLYAELIRRLTVKGERVADFFVGSGACLLAAQSLDRDFFGVERDQDRYATAVSRLSANVKR